MIVLIVRLHSALSEEELLERAHERAPHFRALPGLIQKYYVRGAGPGEYSGVYVWDSKESLAAYRDSELARSIPAAYEVTRPPEIEIGELIFPLRE